MNIVKFLCDSIKLDNIKKSSNDENIIQMIVTNLDDISNIYETEENSNIYIDLDDDLINLNLKVIYKKENFDISIYKQTFKIKEKEIYTLEVTITSVKNNPILYELKIDIKNILKDYFKEIYIMEDNQNELLCTSLYYKIHKIENLFRSLINNYMLRKYGIGWFKNNITNKYQSKVTEYSTWYNKNYTTFRDIKNELFNLQTDDLIEMLQNSYINTLDKSDIETINKLKSKLREKSNMVIKQEYINLKSIWEEDISLYLPGNFVDTWHEFSKMRNMVAHNKPICKELEKDICSKIEELNGIMDSFKNKINENLKSIEKTNIQKREKQSYYEFECEEAGISPLKDEMQILSDIYESEKWYSFWNQLEDYLISYKNSVEDLSCILDNLLDELNENLFQNCSIYKIITNINLIYEILEFNGLHIDKFHFDVLQTLEENPSLISVILNNLTDLLTANNRYISIDYSLDNYISNYKDTFFEFKDLDDNYIKITYIGGDITPEHGTSDNIYIKLFFNDECLASGKIEISYGDYEMNFDQGYNMPTMEDELNIDLKELETIIEEYFNTRIEQAEYYYDELEEIIES